MGENSPIEMDEMTSSQQFLFIFVYLLIVFLIIYPLGPYYTLPTSPFVVYSEVVPSVMLYVYVLKILLVVSIFIIVFFFLNTVRKVYLAKITSSEITNRIGITFYLVLCWMCTVQLCGYLPFNYPTTHLLDTIFTIYTLLGIIYYLFFTFFSMYVLIKAHRNAVLYYSIKTSLKDDIIYIFFKLPKILSEKHPKTHIFFWSIELLIFASAIVGGLNNPSFSAWTAYPYINPVYEIAMYILVVVIPFSIGIFISIQFIYYAGKAIGRNIVWSKERHK